MREPEYIEGSEALENFERGMIALFKVPKTAIGEGKKEGQKTHCPAQEEAFRQGLEGDL